MSIFREFMKRGMMSSVGGPIVAAVVYKILAASGTVEAFTVDEFFTITLTSALLAFIAGGVTVVYQLERLPLGAAAFLHCAVLFADYLTVYLVNGWLAPGAVPYFIVIFLAGYLLVWLIVWLCIRARVKAVNRMILRP